MILFSLRKLPFYHHKYLQAIFSDCVLIITFRKEGHHDDRFVAHVNYYLTVYNNNNLFQLKHSGGLKKERNTLIEKIYI